MSTGQARILIGAPASGGGKTTFACALMYALRRRGLQVAACKCGPDYIDPMFHREVVGAPSRNLDLFFSTEQQVRALVQDSASASDIVVIEGAMGYYDGQAVSDTASAWHVAHATGTPALLLVDGRGRARSIAAEVMGFARFRAESQVAGVVLNRVSAALYPRLKQLVEDETGVPVLGYLPVLDDCSLESRHLGLVLASEVQDLRQKLERLANTVEETIDLQAVLQVAESAAPLDEGSWLPSCDAQAGPVRIAWAYDDAFCFYYDDTLRLLRALGAQLVPFSPLSDKGLPPDCCGLYLGGGYPELHARQLSENAPMRQAVAAAVAAGMPTVAECGGFLYLHQALEGDDGATYSQVGSILGAAFRTKALRRFGYATLTAHGDGLLAPAGGTLQAHEFHYWESECPGDAFHAQKPQSAQAWECCVSTPSLHAGFPHLYLPANPEAANRFVEACRAFASGKGA